MATNSPTEFCDHSREHLRAATDAGADHILITGWNEWPETTVIEPSSWWTNRHLCLEVVAEWRGVEFIVPPPVAAPARRRPRNRQKHADIASRLRDRLKVWGADLQPPGVNRAP